MTEQTQSDDVKFDDVKIDDVKIDDAKIPAQPAAPATARTVAEAAPAEAAAGAEPVPGAGAAAEVSAEPVSTEGAAAEVAGSEQAPAEAVAGSQPAPAEAEAEAGAEPPAEAVPTEALVEAVAGAEPARAEEAPAEPAPATGAPAEAVAPVARKRLRDRRGLRAAVRWTAAVVVFAALGGAAAYAVTQPERTEIPGLETPDDGRWTYPALKLPKLPAGAPRALDDEHNEGGRHYADLRTLLLPVPAGAKRDTSFPDRGGWLPPADFVKIYPKDDRDRFRAALEDNTLRHIAARAWTMPDGTRTEIYLLQFFTDPYTTRVRNELIVPAAFAGADRPPETDTTWADDDKAVPRGELVSPYDEPAPRGATHLRAAYITAGDTLAVVHMEKPGTQSAVPFHQTVLLQSQLLG